MTINNEKKIYKLSSDARIRKEGQRFLLVNIATQGLHFVSPIAYSLVEKLDGQEKIINVINSLWPTATEDEKQTMYSFLNKLVDRNVLEVIK